MPSPSYLEWQQDGLARLEELERLHNDARGTGPGRRWGTGQLNRSLLVALVAQFQTYCRGVHEDAVDVHVVQAVTAQAEVLRTLMTQGRKLDVQNPRASVLASDFRRVGFDLVKALKAEGPAARRALTSLDVLVDFRNAVVHGNETRLGAIVATGAISPTLVSYRAYRQTIIRLATTMDAVIARKLGDLLQIRAPW